MEWIVIRLMQRGRRAPPHLRNGQLVRGQVAITDENLRDRGLVRVARVVHRDIPPLIDARLMPTSGGCWRLAGFESVPDGPLGDEVLFAQVWSLEPAQFEDLARAETRLAEVLRKQDECPPLGDSAGIQAAPSC